MKFPPISGFLYTSSGSYNSSFFIGGGAVAFASCLMFLIPWFIPHNPPDDLLLAGEENHPGSSNPSKPLDKKDSFVTCDSGIDLTLKEQSVQTCTLDEASNAINTTRKKKRKLSNIFERIRAPSKVLVPGNFSSSFAVSTLDLNSNDGDLVVVEKVSIV